MAVRLEIDEQRIADVCRRHHIRHVALFDSVLRDDVTADRGVDVLVRFDPHDVPGFAFARMQEERGEILGRRVDMGTPGFLSPSIRDRVEREAHPLYHADRQ